MNRGPNREIEDCGPDRTGEWFYAEKVGGGGEGGGGCGIEVVQWLNNRIFRGMWGGGVGGMGSKQIENNSKGLYNQLPGNPPFFFPLDFGVVFFRGWREATTPNQSINQSNSRLWDQFSLGLSQTPQKKKRFGLGVFIFARPLTLDDKTNMKGRENDDACGEALGQYGQKKKTMM